MLEEFRKFLAIDFQLKKPTVYDHVTVISDLTKFCDPTRATKDQLREYLSRFIERPKTYAWHLCALKRFYRDFLEKPDLVKNFRFPTIIPKPKIIPSKKELQGFSCYLDRRDLTLFLVLATSGLRRSEVITLQVGDVDFNRRMFLPKRTSKTKFAWIGFFNQEAEGALKDFLATRKDSRPALFPYAREKLGVIWKEARQRSGLDITPQVLREWFAEEMSNLGVPERYIDAFQGRMPRSVLARHYTDYNPRKLKRIYDDAGLKVLG